MKTFFAVCALLVALASAQSGGSVCRLDYDPGHCYEEHFRWAWDRHSGRCVMFVYTGCDGNGNRYNTLDECQRACHPECYYEDCYEEPCYGQSCPAYPHARCINDYCYGCDYRWYNGHEEVTDYCYDTHSTGGHTGGHSGGHSGGHTGGNTGGYSDDGY